MQHPNSPWPERDQELRDLCADPLLTYREIGKRMGLSADVCIGRAYRKGFREPLTAETRAALIVARAEANVGAGWTQERVQKLRDACANPDMTWAERSVHCGMTLHAARQKARDLGIKCRATPKPKAPATTPPTARSKAKPRRFKPEPNRQLSANDSELIAEFLSRKTVTACPKGWAFGADTIQYVGKSGRAA